MRIHMSGLVSGLACAAVIAATFAMPARAQLLTHKDLSYDLARAIAEGAIAACKAKGYGTSAVVVDRDGETIIAMRGDGASPHTMENARRKAYTAMTFKQTTSAYAKKWSDGNPVVRAQVTLPNIIPNPGGVPIKIGDEVIGGIGVSGSPGVEEDCVNSALAKVADQLK
jgi:uncharacterized protein GlcG (DUF336 family)